MKVVKFYRGYTLVELLISMGILMILISILTTVFGQILDVQLDSKSVSSVDQNGRYILARLMHDVQSAESIQTPATAGQQSNSLQLVVNSLIYTYSVNGSDNLALTVNSQADVLNSDAVRISGLTFTRLGNGSSNDTVRVSFTVTSRTQRTQGSETKSFQTTVGLP